MIKSIYHFGNLKDHLLLILFLLIQNFYLNIILGGSSALMNAYINKDFYSSNLTNLIELNRNIKLFIHFQEV